MIVEFTPPCVELLCLQVRSTLRLLDHVLHTLELRSAISKRSPGSAVTGTSEGKATATAAAAAAGAGPFFSLRRWGCRRGVRGGQ